MANQNFENDSDIPVFWNSTNGDAKDKFLQFASSLNDLPPNVVKKAIEQIPEFSITMLSMANGFREMLFNLTKQNADGSKKVYDECSKTLDALQKMLSNDNLKFEEKKWVIEKNAEILHVMKDIDSANKAFWLKVASFVGTVFLSVVGIVAREKKPKSFLERLFGK